MEKPTKNPIDIINRMFSKTNSRNDGLQLETLIDMDKGIELFRTNGLKALKPQILYKKGKFRGRSAFYRHEREQPVSSLEGYKVVLELIDKRPEEQLLTQNLD